MSARDEVVRVGGRLTVRVVVGVACGRVWGRAVVPVLSRLVVLDVGGGLLMVVR